MRQNSFVSQYLWFLLLNIVFHVLSHLNAIVFFDSFNLGNSLFEVLEMSL